MPDTHDLRGIDDDVLDRQPSLSARSRPTRSRRSQPERSPGKVETMISSIRSSRIACIAAVYGSGCAIWPVGVDPSARSVAKRLRADVAPPPGARSRCGSLCGETIRKLAGPSAARAGSGRAAARRAPSRWRRRGRWRPGLAARRRDDVLDRARSPATLDGSRRPGCGAASPTSSPDAWRRSARRRAPGRAMSFTASSGPPSNTTPCAGTPAPVAPRAYASSRRPAAARRVSS